MGLLRLGLAQINTTVGDLEGNLKKITTWIESARDQSVDIVVFPELTITGYPPEDLLLNPQFITDNEAILQKLIPETEGITALVGFAHGNGDLFNAAAVMRDGKLLGAYYKHLLPNYCVFDEHRYFKPGSEFPIFTDGKVRFGVTICEDVWQSAPPIEAEATRGKADLVINMSASPYHMGKGTQREAMLATRAKDFEIYFAFCNLVGGQDELIFSGRSAIFGPDGNLIGRAKSFEEDLLIADLDLKQVQRRRLHEPRWRFSGTQREISYSTPEINLKDSLVSNKKKAAIKTQIEERLSPPVAAYQALELGTRDYVQKNGHQKVLIGLSGGIDSALVACIAADALGPENVIGVFMPSRFTAKMSREDAEALAKNLKIKLLNLPIDDVFDASLKTLAPFFEKKAPCLAEENLQARIRGNILMALSNKFGWLVISTGNKTEYAMGYTTLYGDMVGALAVIRDVPKKLVYELANWRNEQGFVIPKRTITRPPSAELRMNQKDEDDLPAPYCDLDAMLNAYVENDQDVDQITQQGFKEKIVAEVMSWVDHNEYKRRQGPIGLKITPRAFGRDRRYPITNHYHQGASDAAHKTRSAKRLK
jgi:NAD+ synthase (glutamine-hydrolysing)